jgi:hypothetical protein
MNIWVTILHLLRIVMQGSPVLSFLSSDVPVHTLLCEIVNAKAPQEN